MRKSNDRKLISDKIRDLRDLRERFIAADNESSKKSIENDIRKFMIESDESLTEFHNKHLKEQLFGLATIEHNNQTLYPFIDLSARVDNVNRKFEGSGALNNDIVVLQPTADNPYSGGIFSMYNYFSGRKPINSKSESGREILKEQVRRKSRRRESLLDRARSRLTNSLNQIVVRINDIILWIGQEATMSLSLYDTSEDKFISEEVSIPFLLNSNPIKCDGPNVVVFRDVQTTILDDIWVVCKIVRLGPLKYDALKADQMSRNNSLSHIDLNKSKRPYSASAMRLTDFVSSKELCMPLYEATSEELFHDIHQLIINESRDSLQTLSKAKGITLSVSIHKGAWKNLNLSLKSNEYLIARPLRISEALLSPEDIDTRNDLYITIEEGSFHDRKNIELVVEARPREITRKLMPRILYRSTVYYHEKEPKWYETFKINIDEFKDLDHLYIAVRHIHENGKVSDLSFVYLPLRRQDKSFLPNSQKTLPCYRIQKVIDDTYYVKEAPKQHKSDVLRISTNLVSTKFSENVPLMTLLNWKSNIDNISDIVAKCKIIPKKDIANFCADILDAVFGIMDLMEESVPETFHLLLSMLSTCIDDQDGLLVNQVDKYIKESFSHAKAHVHIMNCLKEIFRNITIRSTQRNAALVFKTIEYLLKIVIKSRQLYILKKGGSEGDVNQDYEFKKEIISHINDFTNTLQFPQHELLGIQAKYFKTLPTLIQTVTPIFSNREMSFITRRVLESFQNANQVQLNVEKLLFLETYQYSAYVGLYTVFSQLKNHMRQSVEERLHCVRILKNILLPMLNSYLAGKLNLNTKVECFEFEFVSDSLESPTSSSKNPKGSFSRGPIKVKTVDSIIDDSDVILRTTSIKKKSKSGRIKSDSIPRENSPRSNDEESTDSEESQFEESLMYKLNSAPRTKRKSIPTELLIDVDSVSKHLHVIYGPEIVPKVIERENTLYALLLDMIPSVSRILRKTEEGDRELRIELGVCLLSLLKILDTKMLREHIRSIEDKSDRNQIIKAIIEAFIPLVYYQSFPLIWPEMLYTLISTITEFIDCLLAPYVLQFKPEQMDEEELFMFSRLFRLSSIVLVHISLNIERHILRPKKFKVDYRDLLIKNILQLWTHFEFYRILVVHDSTTQILEMIVSRNESIKNIGTELYYSLIKRDMSISSALSESDKSPDKIPSKEGLEPNATFPHVEVATIHALEELSNSTNWDETALKQFFSEKYDFAIINIKN